MDSLPSGEAGSTPTYTIFRNKHGIPQFEPKRGTQALKDALIYAFPTFDTELQLMQAALRKFFDSERGSRSVFELPERDLQAGLARGKDTGVRQPQPGTAILRNVNSAARLRTPSMSSWRSSTRPSSRASSRASSRTSTSRRSSRAESPFLVQDGAGDAGGGGGVMTTWMLSTGQELEKRRRQPYDPARRRRVAENRGNACDRHRASKTTCDPDSCPQNKLYGKVTQELMKGRGSLASQSSSVISRTTGKDSMLDIDSPWNASDESMGRDDSESQLSFSTPQSDIIANSWIDQQPINYPWSSFDSHNSHLAMPSVSSNAIFSSHNASEPILEASNMQPHEYQEFAPLDSISSDSNFESFQQPELWQSGDRGHIEEQILCSDDPFMGWANKRASKALEDYGWVLSHVESL